MPRTNLCKPAVNPLKAEIRGCIAGGMARNGINMKELSRITKIPYSTLSKRLKEDPGSMTFNEYWAIDNVVKLRTEEKARFFKQFD